MATKFSQSRERSLVLKPRMWIIESRGVDPVSYQKPAGQRNARSVSLRLIHTPLESQKGLIEMGGGGG